MSSPTMYIEGIKLGTENHKAMVRIAKECLRIGIRPPKEVIEYLGNDWECADESGVIVKFEPKRGLHQFIREFCGNMTEGYEINIPMMVKNQPDVNILRVYNSY